MSARNLGELGLDLQKIVKRLTMNQRLLKLLYYTGKDPYSEEDITQEQIQNEIYEKQLKVVPRIGTTDTARSFVTIRVVRGLIDSKNSETRNFEIAIEVFVPLTQWMIKDSNLRPFAIMGEIHNSLNGKIIDGFGKMSGGNFNINFLTEEMCSYEMNYYITNYD